MRLHEEHERCLLYLDASTKKPLISTAEKQLLERHISAILDKVWLLECHMSTACFSSILFNYYYLGAVILIRALLC